MEKRTGMPATKMRRPPNKITQDVGNNNNQPPTPTINKNRGPNVGNKSMLQPELDFGMPISKSGMPRLKSQPPKTRVENVGNNTMLQPEIDFGMSISKMPSQLIRGQPVGNETMLQPEFDFGMPISKSGD